jgi:hypothetical protein
VDGPADDPAPLSLFDRMLSRPTEADLERAFARMRDRLSAQADLGLPRPRYWACGVHRLGGFRWVHPGC